jgi:hypothetical protein
MPLTSANNGSEAFREQLPSCRKFLQPALMMQAAQGSMSLQLDNPSKCNAVVIEALLLGKSDPAFPVRGGNVDVHDCNVPFTI